MSRLTKEIDVVVVMVTDVFGLVVFFKVKMARVVDMEGAWWTEKNKEEDSELGLINEDS